MSSLHGRSFKVKTQPTFRKPNLRFPPIRLQVDIPHSLQYDVNKRLIKAKRQLDTMNLYNQTYPLKLVQGYLVERADVTQLEESFAEDDD